VLFFLERPGWLFSVAGEPGRSDMKLSCDERGRRPRNLRTELGRLLAGLVGYDWLASSFVVVCCRFVYDGLKSLAGGVCSCCGKTADFGVGWDDSGPLPGVGGRGGSSGGESGGAGIEVPSVREKLIGVRVSGEYFPPAMMNACRHRVGGVYSNPSGRQGVNGVPRAMG
jgi:hypothetical protein